MDKDWCVFSLSVEDKQNEIMKEILAQRWGIGLVDTAHKTLKCTMQRGRSMNVFTPTYEHVSTQKPSCLVFPMTMLGKKLNTDTMFFAKICSLHSNTAMCTGVDWWSSWLQTVLLT